MNKNQALGAMDAHLIRVTTERDQRLERRQRYLLRLYPALKQAPLEQRFNLFREARRHAFRQWSPYAALGILILVAGYLLRDQFMGIAQEVRTPTLLPMIAMAIVPGILIYAHTRAYLRLRVGVQG